MASPGILKRWFFPRNLASENLTRKFIWEAARRIGVEPAQCVYVGDNPVRDVEGTLAAGYGMFILFFEPATQAKEPPTTEIKPDYTIRAINELLDIFPSRK